MLDLLINLAKTNKIFFCKLLYLINILTLKFIKIK